MTTEHKPHSTLAQARLALAILSKSQHLNGDHPVVVLGDCLDSLEEQLEAQREALEAVIQHVEDAFPGGTRVDPVFVMARAALNPASEPKETT